MRVRLPPGPFLIKMDEFMKEIYENFEQIRERFDILKSNYLPYEFLSKGFLN